MTLNVRWRCKMMCWLAAGLAVVVVFAAILAGPVMSHVEQPEYQIETSESAIEIPSYGPMCAPVRK